MYEKTTAELVSEPIHQVISNLINHSSKDEDTCCVVSLAFTLTLWQLCGTKMTHHVPSTMLVSSGDSGKDPIDCLIKSLIDDGDPLPSEAEKNELRLRPEQVEPYLAATIAESKSLDPLLHIDPRAREAAVDHSKNFMKALKLLIPGGKIKSYADAWHKKYGLISESDDEVMLRLNTKKDFEAFIKDVLSNRNKLFYPQGIGFFDFQMVDKVCSFSGALSLDHWNDSFVDSIIGLGLPIIFLPHTATHPLKKPNAPAVKYLEAMLTRHPERNAITSLCVTPDSCLESHMREIRQRLHCLPGNGTYEFAILQVLHQIEDVCLLITRVVQASLQDEQHLHWDLYNRAIRAIYIGVVALGWHALGFELGCPRPLARKILKRLRTKGPMRTEELQKFASLSEGEWDAFLRSFSSEGLIKVETGTVRAESFDDFIRSIHTRDNVDSPQYSKDLASKSR